MHYLEQKSARGTNKIRAQIKNSAYEVPNIGTEQSATVYSTLGFSLSSAIACAVVKTTGRLFIIEKEQNSKDGRDLTLEYHILEQEA